MQLLMTCATEAQTRAASGAVANIYNPSLSQMLVKELPCKLSFATECVGSFRP
jgi:hypothetical protein